jgi:A/G-specific adenine glycosylase
LPDDEATLRSFKGIGAYTAGALMSFAFRQRAAILDTNVARVLFRVFIRDGELKSHAMTRQLWEVSRAVLPRRDVFDFNQALMDLGALVCTARKPRCLVCPMEAMCQTRGLIGGALASTVAGGVSRNAKVKVRVTAGAKAKASVRARASAR